MYRPPQRLKHSHIYIKDISAKNNLEKQKIIKSIQFVKINVTLDGMDKNKLPWERRIYPIYFIFDAALFRIKL